MKNNKKGFTLIELLAVIVILAIIALIATPIILGVIGDSQKQGQQRSVELYTDAVKNAASHYMMLNPTDNNVTLEDIQPYIKYDGATVNCIIKIYPSGNIYITNCKVNGVSVDYVYGTAESTGITYDQDNDGVAELGDILSIESEEFYVISNDGTNIIMLSKYNLGLTDPVKQSYNAPGVASFINETNGTYWLTDDGNLSSGYPLNATYSTAYVYDAKSNLYQYVKKYEDYLHDDLGLESAVASLMTTEYMSIANGKEWLNERDYWLGFTNNYGHVWYVANGTIDTSIIYGNGSTNIYNLQLGVRPVVQILASELN